MKCIYILLGTLTYFCMSTIAQNINYSRLVERQNLVYQVNSEVPYSGKVFKKFANGQNELEGSFLKGKKNGKWIEWSMNGQKNAEENYLNGKYNGKVSKWRYDGLLLEECNYSNGIFNGDCKLYHTNGKQKFSGSYIMGQYNGFIEEYTYDGTLSKSANYNNGVLNGDYWKEPERGNRFKCVYKDGILNGKYTSWHYTGKPAIHGEYKNGLREGEFVYNYPDGNLEKKITYKNGSKEGDVLYYSNKVTAAPDNKLRAKMHYDNDKLNGKYSSWSEIGVGQHIFTAEEEYELIREPSDIAYKLEGCFINGIPEGVFKFWVTGVSDPVAKYIYERLIFDNGALIDNGWVEGGHVPTFTPNDELTQ